MKTLSVSMTPAEQRIGWGYLLVQMFLLPNLIAVVHDLLGAPLNAAQLNFLFFALNFLCATVIFRKFLLQTLRHTARRIVRCLRAAFLGFIVYYGCMLLISFLLMRFFPDFSNVNDETVFSMTRENFTLMSIGTIVLVPITEELLYRGLIFRQLHGQSRWLGYAVSTFVFCSIHVAGYIGTYDAVTLLLCFVQYIPAGLCLGWAYEQADSLIAPVLIHMTINQIGISAVR